MQNSVIAADKITASSGTAGDQARLNYTNGPSWCAIGNDDNPYLQIDLGTPHIICAVSTQGDHLAKQWVKTFQLNCSDDGKTYHPYKENGNTQQTFYGNVDNSGIFKQILYQGIIARYLRILPIMQHGAVCMRAEIYGIRIQSTSKVNYAYDKTATQSSTGWDAPPDRAVDGNRNPNFDSVKSCTHTEMQDNEPWWMVDLGQSIPVYEVFIVNRKNHHERLHDFLILIGGSSSNGGKSNPVCNSVKGPLPSGIGTSIYCHQSMMGRFLTITFDNHVGILTLCEVEVYTEVYMELAIGISNSSAVPDNRMSASSNYSNTRTAAKARLLGNYSWRPRDDDTNPWLQIDLGEIYYVCAVATQGDPDGDERTIKYKVEGSIDNLLWMPVESKTLKKEMVFSGNQNKSTSIIKHSLPSPLAARFVRFYPVENIEAYALRVEIYGVTKVSVPPIPPPIGNKELHPSLGSHIDLVCRAEGGLSIKWYHNDTDITSYSIGSVGTGSILISTLRVNYTSVDDVYDKYSCDATKMYCTSLDYICQVDYGSYRKLQSRGKISTLLVPTRPRHLNATINPQRGTQRPTVTLKWEKPMRAIGKTTSYTLCYNYVIDNNSSMKSLTITDLTGMSYTIDVIGGARFEFYLKAKANGLIGDPSQTWTANIQECKPSSAPANIKVIKIENGKYNVSWEETPRELNNSKIITYEINWSSLARRMRRSTVASRAANASESTYTLVNISLTDNMKYNITVRGYTIAGPGPFSDPIVLEKEIEKADGRKEDDQVPDSVIVVAVVFSLLFVVGMIVFIFWYKKRKGQEDTTQQENPGGHLRMRSTGGVAVRPLASHQCDPDEYNQNENQNEGNIEMVEVEGDAIYENKTEKISIRQFPDFMNRVRRNEHELLMHQFKILPQGRLYPCTVAMKPINKSKNRYGNIIPYNNSRVVLEKLEGDEDSDYINASYIWGYDCKQISYIATQGPLPQTVNDFWRMIWQEKMSVIVMLTGIKEQNKIKCEKYWPENSKTYQDLSVHLHKTEVFADYSIRTFVVSKMKTREQRYVFQYHFTAWTDKGVPQHATQLLAFRRRLESDTAMGSPWVVHSSTGVGRTGAFLAIDAMIRQARDYKTIDVFNFVKTMRQNRQNMVQTKEQYLFIHMAILEHLTCRITEVQAQQLGKTIKKLTIYDRKEKITGFEKEFKHLSALCPDVPKDEMKIGSKACNSKKNRFQHILPLDKARVILQADPDKGGNDYINASYANGYRQKDAYILTQAPLDTTIADFWKMIYDNKLGTIVMLNENKEEKMSYPSYWPEKGSLEFGNIPVEIIQKETEKSIVSRVFTLTHKSDGPNKPHKVRHLQHTGWSDGSVPGTTTSVLDLVEKIQRSQQQSENKPVVVLCSDGVGRSGTMCTILSLLDRVKTEQMVDVFQTVKALRISRPGAVDTAIQYQFCFQVVMDYLESFSEYANFNG
uniref:protein-tyrosine-phosphatase n=1 Tax=Actinia tenebrosa TaxID=6105 RepID=A0A6P8I6N2_ACTTE